MERVSPAVVPLESVPAVPKEQAPTKVRIARLVTNKRCGANLLLGVAWLDPGDKTNIWSTEERDTTLPGEHWYGPLEETYFVLRGRLRLTWTNGVLEFGANDAVYLAPGWRYQLENVGDEQAMLIYSFHPTPE
jgi:mannose-6-phosphate isomerase-like protein (cupin superfamily)